MHNAQPASFFRSATLFVTVVATLVASSAAAEPPGLVVVVSVDQWRYEYFQRFRGQLSDQGIAHRCRKNGTWFDRCFHQHAFTYTAPGHAVLLTGTYPSRNGIIGNSWYDRDEKRELYCVADPDATIIGTTSDEQSVSPKRLLVDTVGDQMKLATGGKSKVFGLAIKDRAAILMAGKLADAAYWMDYDGNWITTDYYRATLPGYLRNLNELKAVFRHAGQTWEPLFDRSNYVHGETEDSTGERPRYEMTADFPHVLPSADDKNYIRNLACSPFGNEVTLEAAREIVVHEKLGGDEIPDLLAINLSSPDYVGHSFGPYSLEVEDMTYRTDIALGQFAAFLDGRLEQRGWVMFVTADHGVAPIPERVSQWKVPAGRDPLGTPDSETENVEPLRSQLEAHLREALQAGDGQPPLVEAVQGNQVFLNRDNPLVAGAAAEVARRLTRDRLMDFDAIAYAATREQLLQDNSADPMLRLLHRSFHPRRSGDVVFVLAPYNISGDAGTTHGSPWDYDRHVPLMVLGNLFGRPAKEQVVDEVSPAAIGPTISQILQIAAPSACSEESLPISFSP